MTRRKSKQERLRNYLADRDVACPNCAYNLRGLESPTCPECGFGFDEKSLRIIEHERHWWLLWLSDTTAFALMLVSLGLMFAARGLNQSPRFALVGASVLMLAFAAGSAETGWCGPEPVARRWRLRFLIAAAVGLQFQASAFIAQL